MDSSKLEKAAAQRGASRWNAEQAREFEKITAQSCRLGERLKAEDFDKEGNATGAWAKVLSELDAWAAQYKVEIKTTEHESRAARSAKPGGKPETRASACPGTTTATETVQVNGGSFTIKTTCHLRRQTLFGRCVFSCVSVIQ
jgi:hypothetical protein